MSTFADRVGGLIRSAVVGYGASMAWDVGIFQALATAKSPVTSLQIAKAKNLKERYVRELLGCLATAELVQVSRDKDGGLLYSLEDGAMEALQGRTGAIMGFPGTLTSLYSPIKSCISSDGPYGTRYSDSVQEFFDELLGAVAPKMVSDLLQNVPNMTPRLEKGLDVMEVGAGGARLSAILATKFTNSCFQASEINATLVESNKVRWAHIPNLSFSVVDLCALPETPEKLYDWVFCNDVIHDLPDPLAALRCIQRLLRKPDGLFMFIDIATSGSPVEDKGNMGVSFYYAASTFLCIPESYQSEDSLALGSCWGKPTALKMIKEAGFDVRDLMLDSAHALYICTLPC
ncbi:methyltransferase domain protein [Elysia marginata]|uniref:Methyltransferase domain protein n=1 Tax=Elysia marginata TaxID=1093978 RepID=A0AAV4I8I2_9GAST|nr:methyltransferase domain protein [Elysia marginata]